MESEGSLPYSQQQVPSPNAQADKSQSSASHLNTTHLIIILSYDTIRWENHEWTYCHVSELCEHPIVFAFPSVMGVQVSNYWFGACSDLCLTWKRHGMAHSCITIPGTQLLLQFLAHSCINIHVTQLNYNPWHTAVITILGTQLYYYPWHTAAITILGTQLYNHPWHTAVLQSLAHSCITVLGIQLYYNPWQTAVLQFLAHRCYHNAWHTAV